MANPLDLINALDGLKFVNGAKSCIEIEPPISVSSLGQMLYVLALANQPIAFYDPWYPSMSDPGAYFRYAPVKAGNTSWQMTLGNHGWSGGRYEIDDQTICCQLGNLNARDLLRSIELHDVAFFSHYNLQSDSRSLAINKQLVEIHTANQAPEDPSDS